MLILLMFKLISTNFMSKGQVDNGPLKQEQTVEYELHWQPT